MRYVMAALFVGLFVSFSFAGSSLAKKSKTVKPYKVKSQKYTFGRSETLSEILLARGVGKKGGQFNLYGRKGWIKYNMDHNPQIKNWDRLKPGLTFTLYYPEIIKKIKRDRIITIEPMNFDHLRETKG